VKSLCLSENKNVLVGVQNNTVLDRSGVRKSVRSHGRPRRLEFDRRRASVPAGCTDALRHVAFLFFGSYDSWCWWRNQTLGKN
jgi:hypothetical protein